MPQATQPHNYDDIAKSVPTVLMSFFCPLEEWTADIPVRVFEVLEELVPGIRIGWELKFITKDRHVNGHYIEDFEHRNISLGEKRIEYIEKLRSGQVSFWNGEKERLIKVSCTAGAYASSPDNRIIKCVGYSIDIAYSPAIMDYEQAFKTIGQVRGIQFALDYSCDAKANHSIRILEVALRREFHRLSRYEQQYLPILEELAPHLPKLRPGDFSEDRRVASRILWMNYWNAETAAFYNFPDPEKDARLLYLVEQLQNGGWFFKLTEEPLDLTRADHREAIIWAYQRFRPVGQPVEPVEKNAGQQKTAAVG